MEIHQTLDSRPTPIRYRAADPENQQLAGAQTEPKPQTQPDILRINPEKSRPVPNSDPVPKLLRALETAANGPHPIGTGIPWLSAAARNQINALRPQGELILGKVLSQRTAHRFEGTATCRVGPVPAVAIFVIERRPGRWLITLFRVLQPQAATQRDAA